MTNQAPVVLAWLAIVPLAIFFVTAGISLFYTRTMKPLWYGFGISAIWAAIVMISIRFQYF
jgi:hypothetical protein